jgi:hypothetical protein
MSMEFFFSVYINNFNKQIFHSRRWGSSLPGLRMQDPPLGPCIDMSRNLYSTNSWPGALQVYRCWNKQLYNFSKLARLYLDQKMSEKKVLLLAATSSSRSDYVTNSVRQVYFKYTSRILKVYFKYNSDIL